MHSLHLMHPFDTTRGSFGSGSYLEMYRMHAHIRKPIETADEVNQKISSTPCLVLHPALKPASKRSTITFQPVTDRTHPSLMELYLQPSVRWKHMCTTHLSDSHSHSIVCTLLPGVDRHTVCMLSRDFQTLRTPLLHPLCPAQPDHHCHFK